MSPSLFRNLRDKDDAALAARVVPKGQIPTAKAVKGRKDRTAAKVVQSVRAKCEARDGAKVRTRPCAHCGFDYRPRDGAPRKYCSPKCYHASQAERRKSRTVSIKCAAPGCSSVVVRDSRRIKKRGLVFCSQECSRAAQVAANNTNWRGGGNGARGRGWKRISEEVRVRDGRKCRWCGKSEEQNGRRLSVDHVRPWREFESEQEANDKANLVSLCQTCHGKKLALENRWLRGDGLALQEYRRFVGIVVGAMVADTPLPQDACRLKPTPRQPGKRGPCPAVAAAKKAYYAQPGMKEKWRALNRARVTPAWREKVSAATRKAMANPEIKARHLKAVRTSRSINSGADGPLRFTKQKEQMTK